MREYWFYSVLFVFILISIQTVNAQQGAQILSSFRSGLSGETSWVEQGESKVINFTLVRESWDYPIHNITFQLPHDQPESNFTYSEGGNGTTLDSSDYSFITNSTHVILNATNTTKGLWNYRNAGGTANTTNYVWFNITSNNPLGHDPIDIIIRTNDSTINQTLDVDFHTTMLFSFTAEITDMDNNALSNSNLSISVQDIGTSPPSDIGTFTATADQNGSVTVSGIPTIINVTIANPTSGSRLMYQISANKYNASYATHTSLSIPQVPFGEFYFGLNNSHIRIKPAYHFRVRAVDSLGNIKTIEEAEIKDQKLGYDVQEYFSAANQRDFVVPAGRNYTITIRPQEAFSMGVKFNNISNVCDGNGNLSTTGVDATCTEINGADFINVTINTSSSMQPFTGYFNNVNNVSNMRVMIYSMDTENMVFSDWAMPINIGNMSGTDATPPNTDSYNTNLQNFTVYIPATQATSWYTLRAYAKNSTNDYFIDEYIINASGSTLGESSHNFTMSELIDADIVNISTNDVANSWEDTNATETSMVKFYLVNGTGTLLTNENAMVEIEKSIGTDTYKYLTHASSGYFHVPIEKNENIPDLVIYSQSYAPISTYIDSSVLSSDSWATDNTSAINCQNGTCNITMRSFASFDPAGENTNFKMMLLKSNATCDVPNPPQSCNLMGANSKMNETEFSPLKALIKGGDMSLLMKSGNISGIQNSITVLYKNVDMLASGPPDAAFSSQDFNDTSTRSAWKFGSQGPEIYDQVLIAMPYQSELSDETIQVDIPVLYDNDFNVVWNRTAGDTITDIENAGSATELSRYSDYVDSEYESYLNGTNVTCSESDSTLSLGLCYKDTTYGLIWIKIPHFSALGPEVASVASTTSSTPASSSSGGGGLAINRRSRTWNKISANALVSMKIYETEIGIREIEIRPKNELSNVKITLSKVDGKPSTITHDVPGKVYKYIHIEHENIQDSDLENAYVYFEVKKSWLEENETDKNDIILLRYTNQWTELSAEIYEETANYVKYKASVPGFSYFAIASKPEQITTTTTTTVPETTTTTTKPSIIDSVGKLSKIKYLIIGIIAIIVVLVFVLLLSKKK